MTTGEPSFAELTVDRLLDRLAAPNPEPGGGAVAAIAVAMAATLCAMAARYSGGTSELVAQAEVARSRATELADEDAAAYRAVLSAGRLPGGARRESGLQEALSAATDVPASIVALAGEVAQLAAQLSRSGSQDLRGDPLTALLLAEAAARAGADIVRINLASAGAPTDRRAIVSDQIVEQIAALPSGT